MKLGGDWRGVLGRLAAHEAAREESATGLSAAERFEARRELGRGAMGRVLLAWDHELGREVALKVLPAAGDDAHTRERFRREAEALGRLDHPYVTAILDVFAGPPLVLVLEFVAGESLAERLRRGPLPVALALRVASEVAQALAAAHAEGVLHRDVKPANVLLDAREHAHLTDFGLARLLDAETLTRTGQVLGSPAYMSPEQATGFVTDARTDVYGLGATLYEALTGEVPLDAHTLQGMLEAIEEQTPIPAHERRPEIGAGLSELCARCLAKSADDRPSTGELLAELRRLGRPSRRSRGALGLALLLVLLTALALGWSRGAPETAPPPPLPPARASAQPLMSERIRLRHPAAQSAVFLGPRGVVTVGQALLRSWSLPSGEGGFNRPLPSPPLWVAARSDGERLACGFHDHVRVWDDAGKLLGRWPGASRTGLWTSEGDLLVGGAMLRVALPGGAWRAFAPGPVRALALAGRNTHDVLLATDDAAERVTLAGQSVLRRPLTARALHVLLWDDRTWIVSTESGAIQVIADEPRALLARGERVTALVRVGPEHLLVARDAGLALWRVEAGEQEGAWAIPVRSLHESPDWEHVLFLSQDTLEVWPRAALLDRLRSRAP